MSNWSNTFQGSIFLPTGSATGSSDGSGILFAKSDGSIYVKNSSGAETKMETSPANGIDPVIREYTANDTWYKPSSTLTGSLYAILVICVGAGGGGGSGRRGAAATARAGGGGGGGGAITHRYILAPLLNNTVSITIGTGGNGAQGVDTDNTNGNAGSTGGDTSFGSFVTAKGSPGGFAGGTISLGTRSGGPASLCIPVGGPFSVQGGGGGGTSVATGVASQGVDGFRDEVSYYNTAALPGGGAGGPIRATDTYHAGGAGGGISRRGTLTSRANGGTVISSPNGQSGNSSTYQTGYVFFDYDYLVTNGLGGGGGGGASAYSTTNLAGNGGSGGPGSGGGGGGAATNTGGTGFPSGNGGNGGDGRCYIIEFYGA